MTLRLTLGIDPGLSGAIAVLADGQFERFIDMPTVRRRTAKGMEVDADALHRALRDVRGAHPGAYVMAVLEKVGGHRGQGGAASFNFGQSDGMVRATLACLGISKIEVYPQTWKTYLRLTGQDKDAARQLVLRLHPEVAEHVTLKKHDGRADAFLIARWAEMTEQVARRAAA